MDRRFRAPGRVNLMGDHTDYNDGFVLPMAIDRECIVTAAPREDGTVRATSGDETATVAADGSDAVRDVRPEWGRYVAGVVRVLGIRGRPPVGVDLQIESAIPAGSGLSSSAALEVALALAMCDAAGFSLPALELALACQESEHVATGVPCGIMDQLASVAGVAGSALLIDCRALYVEAVPLPRDVTVLAVHSGVRRSLENSAYADRRQACLDAARRLGVVALRDATMAQVADEPVARHVVSENERVLATAAALGAGDEERAGALFCASHASLRDDFGVSTPELDALVEALVSAGAYGARLTGAGFGGAVVALAPRARADAIASDGCDAYERRTGRKPTPFRCVAVDGAARLP